MHFNSSRLEPLRSSKEICSDLDQNHLLPWKHFFVPLVCQLCQSKFWAFFGFGFFNKKVGGIDSLETNRNFLQRSRNAILLCFCISLDPDGWWSLNQEMESWQTDLELSTLISTGLRASLLPLTSHLLGVMRFKDGFSLALTLVRSKCCPNHCWQDYTEIFFSKIL